MHSLPARSPHPPHACQTAGAQGVPSLKGQGEDHPSLPQRPCREARAHHAQASHDPTQRRPPTAGHRGQSLARKILVRQALSLTTPKRTGAQCTERAQAHHRLWAWTQNARTPVLGLTTHTCLQAGHPHISHPPSGPPQPQPPQAKGSHTTILARDTHALTPIQRPGTRADHGTLTPTTLGPLLLRKPAFTLPGPWPRRPPADPPLPGHLGPRFLARLDWGASAWARPWGRSEASPPSSRPAPPTSRALTSRPCARSAATAPHHRPHAAPQLPAAPGRRRRRSQRFTSWVSAAGPVRCGRASPVTKRNPPPPTPPPRGCWRRQGAPPTRLQCACATAQPLGSSEGALPLSEAPPPMPR